MHRTPQAWRLRPLAIALAALGGGCDVERSTRTEVEHDYSIAQPESLPPRLTIPIKKHNEHVYVRTHVNGRDIGMFMLDTGSALNVITPGIATRLGLTDTGIRGTAIGIAGREQFTFRKIRSVSIGGLRLDKAHLAGIDLLRFRRPIGMATHGIIGVTALNTVPFTIDYQTSTLTVHRPSTFAPPAGAHMEQLVPYGRLPAVIARVGNDHQVLVILDTGAHGQVALPDFCRRRWPDILAVSASGNSRAVGVGGEVDTIRTWLSSFQLFGRKLRHAKVSFEKSDPKEPHRGPVVGRVGNVLLRHFRLTFDMRRRVIWAEFRPDGLGAP